MAEWTVPDWTVWWPRQPLGRPCYVPWRVKYHGNDMVVAHFVLMTPDFTGTKGVELFKGVVMTMNVTGPEGLTGDMSISSIEGHRKSEGCPPIM